MDIRYFSVPTSMSNSPLFCFFLFKNRYILTKSMEYIMDNDCFNRIMGEYEYVSFFDQDQMLIVRAMRWISMREKK